MRGLSSSRRPDHSPYEIIVSLYRRTGDGFRKFARKAAFADMCSILELQEALDDVVNEFLAVGALPQIVEAPDTSGQYVRRASDLRWEINVPYQIPAEGQSWQAAPHHTREFDYFLARIGRSWDHLDVSAVLRDRHFVSTLRQLVVAHSMLTPDSPPNSDVPNP